MPDIQSILKENWGYDQFRPLQREIIESVLTGKDTLAILPTGGGKSICFQVPAMADKGICLVISPLIALMKDQVENLKKREIPALLIHSGMKRQDVIRTLKNASDDYFKFLYLSPERLETSLFLEYLPSLNINLIAVDEAHCISQWGYDFRPSYLRIAELRKELPEVPVLALTASATPEVQQDICTQLLFEKPNIFRQSFERKNLSYSVLNAVSKPNKLVEILTKVKGCGIVYCRTRKRTKDIAHLLKMHGIAADHYHAGLNADERNARQQDWIKNKIRIIVCTNAFGMGIDKPDVRIVVHMDMPDCLENYYQEAGRAGRDGQKAFAILLCDEKEKEELLQLPFIRFPDIESIRQVYQAMVNFLQIPVHTGAFQSFTFHLDKFISNFNLKSLETVYALKALEQDGWFDFNEKNFAPSSVVFTTSKRSLYEFEKAYPQHEPLLTALLRTYEGIFDFPCFISENLLARLLRVEEDKIISGLKTISAFGMISYTPRNDEPQLYFLRNRVAVNDLRINLTNYYKRKELFTQRIDKIIAYSKSPLCRSQFISLYFGEKDPKPCGICDNCRKENKKDLSTEEFEHIYSLIKGALGKKPLTLNELHTQLYSVKKESTMTVIEFLQSEQKLRTDESGTLYLC